MDGGVVLVFSMRGLTTLGTRAGLTEKGSSTQAQRYGAYCKQVRQPVPAGGSVFMLRDVGGQGQTRAGPASLFLERYLQ